MLLPHAQLIKTTEPDRSKVDHLFIKTSNKVVKVSHDEIQYITSMGAYVRIVTTAGEEVLSLQSMKRMEEVLPGDQFFRVHRSHIINIKHVNSIEGNVIRLDQDNTITLSKSKREDFLRRIDHNNLLYQ